MRKTRKRKVGTRRGDSVSHRRCPCKIKLMEDDPHVLREQTKTTTKFTPRLDEDEACDSEHCRTEMSYKWTLESISGTATLADDDKEKCTVNGRGTFKLCVTVTRKCLARMEPVNPPSDPGAAAVWIVAGKCQDTGCAEYELQ